MMPSDPPPNPSLLSLVAAPVVWAVHFLLSYATSAVWCAKIAERGGGLGGGRLAIALYTIAALVAIAVVAWRAWRSRSVDPALREDRDSAEARHQFLAIATLLLAGLSAIAILYAALAIALVGSCS